MLGERKNEVIRLYISLIERIPESFFEELLKEALIPSNCCFLPTLLDQNYLLFLNKKQWFELVVWGIENQLTEELSAATAKTIELATELMGNEQENINFALPLELRFGIFI